MPSVCPPHHWLLSPPDGPTGVGICRKCGEQREFTNATPDDIDRALQRTLGVKNIQMRGRKLGKIKDAAALLDERPPGWGRFD